MPDFDACNLPLACILSPTLRSSESNIDKGCIFEYLMSGDKQIFATSAQFGGRELYIEKQIGIAVS